jgi:methyl-accepting chemotaxis protein
MSIDIESAVAAHAQWKVKLRSAIASGETLDARSISADDCCALGKWLHGDAKRLMAGRPAFADCLGKHAVFHREAGRVAEAINAKKMDVANAMLEGGTAYAQASSAVGVALGRLKRELAPT